MSVKTKLTKEEFKLQSIKALEFNGLPSYNLTICGKTIKELYDNAKSGLINDIIKNKDILNLIKQIKDFKSYEKIALKIQQQILNYHRKNGVYIETGAEIDFDAKINNGAKIDKHSKICGLSTVGKSVIQNCKIINSVIKDNSVLESSVVEDSAVGSNTTVGPYAKIIKQSKIADNCRMGNFVEVKNSQLGNGVKCAHLAYIGDATLGNNINISCGVVFCNYDGKNKHRTTVCDNVFIGSNVNLIAPVTIEENCFIAAGTTITKNLKEKTFAIGRVRQEEKPRKDLQIY